MQVLVVESQAAAAESLQLLLTAEGHTVCVTDTGEEACDLARLYDYDAIFLALDLDDMTGVQALRALRARKVCAPVIVLGGGQIEARVEALAAGADDVV
ncbi:MAG TPA: response regulator [Phenylobacterium sp.]|nr:response regulator [Phenylobacterium sp.]